MGMGLPENVFGSGGGGGGEEEEEVVVDMDELVSREEAQVARFHKVEGVDDDEDAEDEERVVDNGSTGL